MKITIEHYGKKYSYEEDSDELTSDELVNILFNCCVYAGWHKDSIADAMRDKAAELMKNQAYIRGAACHEEGGEIFVTDQSGNGNHAKLKK